MKNTPLSFLNTFRQVCNAALDRLLREVHPAVAQNLRPGPIINEPASEDGSWCWMLSDQRQRAEALPVEHFGYRVLCDGPRPDQNRCRWTVLLQMNTDQNHHRRELVRTYLLARMPLACPPDFDWQVRADSLRMVRVMTLTCSEDASEEVGEYLIKLVSCAHPALEPILNDLPRQAECG